MRPCSNYKHRQTIANACFTMNGCPNLRSLKCLNLNNSELTCNSTKIISFTYSHVKFPLGWFLFCGTITYSYLPANSMRGPCTLGRLTIPMTSLKRWQKKDLQLLRYKCDSHTVLLIKTEYVELAASFFGVPGFAVNNSRIVSSLACALVKVSTQPLNC